MITKLVTSEHSTNYFAVDNVFHDEKPPIAMHQRATHGALKGSCEPRLRGSVARDC